MEKNKKYICLFSEPKNPFAAQNNVGFINNYNLNIMIEDTINESLIHARQSYSGYCKKGHKTYFDLVIELSREQLIDLHLSGYNKICSQIAGKEYPWDKIKVVAHNQGEDYEFKGPQLYT